MMLGARVTIVCFLTAVVSCQPGPDFRRQEDGSIRVTVPGFPGVSLVTLTVIGEDTEHSLILTKSPEGNWLTNIPDVVIGDDVMPQYVIEYHLPDSMHKTKGHISIANEVPETADPVSPRHLQRRAARVFFDDFSSGTIDRSKWQLAVTGYGGGNEEFNIYTPEAENAFIKDQTLYIKPTLTVDHFGDDFLARGDLDVNAIWGTCTDNAWNGCHLTGVGKIPPIMSAKLMSIGTGHIRYGKVIVQAKMPKGDWLWPAIWLLPTESHGIWPRSGEIDIAETRGNRHYRTWDGHSIGQDYDHVNIHYGDRWDNKRSNNGGYRMSDTTFADGFHDYWIDWTENYIRLGVDDHTILAWDTPSQGYWVASRLHGDNPWTSGGKDAPFDRPFYLILNVAVGGRWFWEANINEGYPQPWKDNSNNKSVEFWNGRHLWEPTWRGDDVAMKVWSVTMEQY